MIRFSTYIALALILSLALQAQAQALVVRNSEFVSTYSLALLCPEQVQWVLRRDDFGKVQREKSWRFTNDISHREAVARHSDYTGSGYDRGHLCPAADRSASTKRMKATFVMSNITPQVPAFNRVTWYQTEQQCRSYAREYDSIGIVAVPVFLDRDTVFIGKHRLAVPHAFFKAVWRLDNDSVLQSWFIFNR